MVYLAIALRDIPFIMRLNERVRFIIKLVRYKLGSNSTIHSIPYLSLNIPA